MSTLEDKMTTLMKALQANRQATGVDEWEGKPQQDPLPIRFPVNAVTSEVQATPTPTVEIVSVAKGPDEESLESLVKTYVECLRKNPPDLSSAPPVKVPPCEVRARDGSVVDFEKLSLADIVDMLDEAM